MDLPQNYDVKKIEENWIKTWKETGIYRWDPTKNREETFVVDTPPPTVSGSLHVGHMFSYSHQDFIVRYQRMKGKNIFFPIGWDDNGLPTERRVQNYLNVRCEPSMPYDPNLKVFPGKKGTPPMAVSRKNFIELCDQVIIEDEKAFRNLWTRLGMSYDWDLEYATIDRHCRLISQASFIELYKKGEVYQEERPVLWDIDYQTAIAQAELVDKDVPSAFYYFRFPFPDRSDYLIIATTRPELLPACVAVLVHPDDERYKKYIGKTILTPLFHVPVPIMADEKAEPEKGTGVVMVCTFGDQTDVEWWKQFNLPLRQIVARNGTLLHVQFVSVNEKPNNSLDEGHLIVPSMNPQKANEVYSRMEGLYTGNAKKVIIEIANQTESVIDRPETQITHAVRFFEKGDRPLEIVPTRQWYTKIIDKKEALIEQGKKINWHPDYMYKRYEHWVEGLNQDWCLSRQRFFGVPIPVWYPINEEGIIVYSKPILPDIKDLPIDPLSDVPHGYTEEQRDKPNGFTGEPDVLDTWATSSLTPQIATHWFLNPERHKKLFPMDIRPQAHDIIRTWAFYTIVKAYLHDGEIPWKNVVLSGWILDPDRKKMSKSHGNVVTPEPLIEQHGADSVRYWSAKARLGVDTAYDEQAFKVGRKLCTKLFNASKFAIMQLQNVDRGLLKRGIIQNPIDISVINELKTCIQRATASFEEFDYAQSLMLTEEFFWNVFCDNYLEIIKPRVYQPELNNERLSACSALRLIHRAIIRLFAPYLPYITEEIWSWEYSNDKDMANSIHRSPWPSIEEFNEVPPTKYPELYEDLILLINPIRKAKADANISLAAPVSKIEVKCPTTKNEACQILLKDVVAMLHVKEYRLIEGNEKIEVLVYI
ncbi:MAG: valine--tRNA ligase [Candidatus Hydrogenedens sp.]